MLNQITIPKVLHLIDSAGMYGAEKVILTLLEELKDSNFQGVLGCIRENDAEVPQIGKEAQSLGIPVKYFTMRRGFNPFGLQGILRFIRDKDICIVHSHGYKPDIFLGVLSKRKFKVVSTVHGWAKNSVGIKGRIYEFIDSMALKRIDRVVAVSNAVSNDLVKRGLKKEKITTIYNGLKICDNPITYDNSRIRPKCGLSNDSFVIGTVGRLTKIKGHYYLIKAMPFILKEITNCQLVIAGDGPLKEDLKNLIEELNLTPNIKIIGYIQDIDQFLSMINLFILPSISEGLPISLLEAMALGKPALCSAVGGIPEVITSLNYGILFPPADHISIADAVKNIFKDQERMNEIAVAGSRLIKEKFSSTIMAKQYSMLYSNLTV